MWAAPVILAAGAAPAFAASLPPPLTVRASNGSSGNSAKLTLTFSGGVGTLSINTVTRNGSTIAMSPMAGIAANGGTSEGGGQTYVAGAAYQVSYTYLLTAFSVNVVAT